MKKNLVFLLFFLGISFFGLAQESEKRYRYEKKGSLVWISLMNGAVLGKGLLWKVSEDSLEFVNLEYKNRSHYLPTIPTLKLHYSEILELKTTPRGAIKKGLISGAAIGLVSGLAVGFATTENPDPYTVQRTSNGLCFILCIPGSTYDMVIDESRDAGVVMVKTLVMTGLGALIGGIMGDKNSIEEKIEGSREKYLALVPELEKQAYWSLISAEPKPK